MEVVAVFFPLLVDGLAPSMAPTRNNLGKVAGLEGMAGSCLDAFYLYLVDGRPGFYGNVGGSSTEAVWLDDTEYVSGVTQFGGCLGYAGGGVEFEIRSIETDRVMRNFTFSGWNLNVNKMIFSGGVHWPCQVWGFNMSTVLHKLPSGETKKREEIAGLLVDCDGRASTSSYPTLAPTTRIPCFELMATTTTPGPAAYRILRQNGVVESSGTMTTNHSQAICVEVPSCYLIEVEVDTSWMLGGVPGSGTQEFFAYPGGRVVVNTCFSSAPTRAPSPIQRVRAPHRSAISEYVALVGAVTTAPSSSSSPINIEVEGSIEFEEEILILDGKNIEIVAKDKGNAIFDGRSRTRLFVLSNQSALSLSNVVLKAGSSLGSGGCVSARTRSHVRLVDCVVSSCDADAQGGAFVLLENSHLTVTSSNLSANVATIGGSVFASSSTLSFLYCRIELNSAQLGGVAHVEGSSVSVVSSTFKWNSAHKGGVISASDDSACSMVSSTLESNSALYWGGVAFIVDSSLSLADACSLASNFAVLRGGVAYAHSSTLSVAEGMFELNAAVRVTRKFERSIDSTRFRKK